MDLKTTGQRLYYLRRRCRLTRKEIENNFKISANSLKTWEDDSRRIKKENLNKLLEIYKSYGVVSSEEWVLGLDDQFIPFDLNKEVGEDSYILKEMKSFEAFYAHSRVVQVTDDYMHPWISKGDYAGGIKVDSTFINKPCIVETKDFGTLVRIIEVGEKKGLYNLLSLTNVANLFNVPVDNVYTIIWLRKRSYSIK